MAHEAAHKIMDKHVPKPAACFHSDYDSEATYTDEDFKRIFSLNETLTNRLGAAIIMPGCDFCNYRYGFDYRIIPKLNEEGFEK